MKFRQQVVVVDRGEYGPFTDGRTIKWFDVTEPGGGAVIRATAGRDLDTETASKVQNLRPVNAELELTKEAEKLKVRLLSLQAAA